MPIYAIDGSEKMSSAEFVKLYYTTLDEILDDPDSSILLTDKSGCGVFVARYLKQNLYRNATIYHTKRKPRSNIANLKTCGGFLNKKECRKSLIKDSDEYINFSK